MENQCGIVRDLLPLVMDEVASEESRVLVEKHVAQCEACRACMEKMCAQTSSAQTAEEERRIFGAAAARLKRRIQRRTIGLMLLGSILAAAVFFAGLLGYDRLRRVTVPVPTEAYGVSLAQMEDGSVLFSADYQGSTTYLGATISDKLMIDSQTGEHKSVLYLGMQRYLIDNGLASPMRNGCFYRIQEADVQALDEIRRGTPEDSVVIWRAGDEIAPASMEMEEYCRWERLQDEAFSGMIESDDGKLGFINSVEQSRYSLINKQLEAIRATVPEWQPWYGETPEELDEETIRWLTQERE